MKEMSTNKAMKKVGLRYFSSLTPKQKDKSIWAVTKLAHDLAGLPDGLARTIAFEGGLKTADLDGQKMFFIDSSDTWFPLEIKDVMNRVRQG
ncbi:hypothetical protein DSECCO2_489470 [anaerobic digester metagenome]